MLGTPTADAAQTRRELTALRPDLVAAYDRALPAARAAIMTRLRLAIDREPGLEKARPGLEKARHGGEPGADESRRDAGDGSRQGRDSSRSAREDAGGWPSDNPGALIRRFWGDVPLAAEIDNSVANLALARAANPTPPPVHPGSTLADLEQLVIDGHPLHPCCRTRAGMTTADVLAYAPEHHPVFRLRRLRVPPGRWYGTAPPILYAHPWQAARLAARYPWLTDDGETTPVRPLMSLRTIAPVDGGPHVKTAVDVQMTSAVRTVSPAAVHNGPLLSALLRKLTADLPIQALAETAAGAVIVDGFPQRHLAHLIRQAPDEPATPLAVFGARPDLIDDPYTWWTRLTAVLFAPLLTLLDRGVALEAHGQNVLVVQRDGLPHRILYRDFGGVRVSPARLREAGLTPPDLHGDLPSDDQRELRTKVAASAFGNAGLDAAAALHRHHGADPARLWRITAAALRDHPWMLTEPLPVKATTAMRLAADPLEDLWAHLDNPLGAA